MTMKMTTDFHSWLWQRRAEACVAALSKNEFNAHAVADTDAARDLLLRLSAGHATYGMGGSDTIRQLGLIEALRDRGKTIYNHWQSGPSPEADLQLRLEQGRCDCFFCSANAISTSGEIVNVDGIGNRTSAMTFGPRKVFIVAGMNKVVTSLEAALKRVREVAAPMRAKSLDRQTPCAKTGICQDCKSPQRICRVTAILHRRPMLTDTTVVLIHQALGF
jgi:hypothetical protein